MPTSSPRAALPLSTLLLFVVANAPGPLAPSSAGSEGFRLPLPALAGPGRLLAQTAPAASSLRSAVPRADDPKLPLPTALVPQVEFWKAIYSRVSKDQVLFHDRQRLDVVYGMTPVPEARTGAAEIANDNYLGGERDRYRRVLSGLARGFDPDTLNGETRRVYDSWGRGSTPGTFAAAAENVRWQRGLRERFIEGLAYSGRYQPYVEQVFREEGVPVELTFLPFVESMYDIQAYSSVGAAGVWQFMPGTGRLFMRVDGTVDERMDPIRAARAAARLLRQNYAKLGTWPLAITAYNHGPYGMMNAVRTMGTRDIERIVKGYQGRGFGFASRNFYTEFLAALDVRRNYAEHLGDVRLDPALEFVEARLPVPGRFSTIARALEIPVEALWDMNPAFTPNARREDRPIPAGNVLRLPADSGEKWGEVLASLRSRPEPALSAPSRPRSVNEQARVKPRARRAASWYTVRPGDSLGAIADRHGLPVSTLRDWNGLGRSSLIRPGQRLRVSH